MMRSVVHAGRSPSLKSALNYTFVNDTRDQPHVPRSGSYQQVRAEIAGIGGDVGFAKLETDLKYYFSLLPSIVSFILRRGRERQRDRETERQRDRETERQRDRETERQRDRETEREEY
jgi:outer membrane protein assembly factor BamA